MRVSITIAAYNELENLTQLIPEVRKIVPQADVIVVDDNSPDGTASFVEALAREDPQVHLIRRAGKMGYASAVQEGHRYALERGAETLCQMDADFSHDPNSLPALLAEIDDYDVVVGSRYVPGGGTQNWGILRQVLSRGGNAFARLLLRLPPRDCTGGFRCYRRESLARSGLLGVVAEGYCFQIVTLYHCHRAGLSVCEVPILFVDRRLGQSKLSKRIILEALVVVLKLWLRGGRDARPVKR
jgi:dolichol-phosphate mannosyltransferase